MAVVAMRARWWARGPHAADPRATISCTRPGSKRPPPSFAFSPLLGSVAPTEKPKKDTGSDIKE